MKLFWPYILIPEQCKSVLKPVGIEHTFWKPLLFLNYEAEPSDLEIIWVIHIIALALLHIIQVAFNPLAGVGILCGLELRWVLCFGNPCHYVNQLSMVIFCHQLCSALCPWVVALQGQSRARSRLLSWLQCSCLVPAGGWGQRSIQGWQRPAAEGSSRVSLSCPALQCCPGFVLRCPITLCWPSPGNLQAGLVLSLKLLPPFTPWCSAQRHSDQCWFSLGAECSHESLLV